MNETVTTIYLISNYPKLVPLEVDENNSNVVVEKWTYKKFIEMASNSFSFNGTLYLDINEIESPIYESMISYKNQAPDRIFFYYFDNNVPMPSFVDKSLVKIYPMPAAPAAPVTPQNVTPAASGRPVIQQTVTNQPDFNTPAQQNVQPVQQEPVQPISQVVPPVSDDTVFSQQPPIQQQVPVQQQPIQQAPIQQQPVQQAPVQPVQQRPVQQAPIQQQPVQPVQQRPVQQQPQNVQPRPAQQQPVQQQPINTTNLSNLLQFDSYDTMTSDRTATPGKIVLFGSSKGGTGKTFTCLASAYWYAKTHPELKIALADFDIIDGQVGISLNLLNPTLQNFYKHYVTNNRGMGFLDTCKTNSPKFSPNIDFYLAPPQDIQTVTENLAFWKHVFELLIKQYDVVFFDSGIDYLGKAAISMLYKIADIIFITSNPSINSVKSVIKQIKSLSGQRINQVYSPNMHILEKIRVILTRVYNEPQINQVVENNISTLNVKIIAKFPNIDKYISQIQWFQRWELIDSDTQNVIKPHLNIICKEIDAV